MNMNNPMFQEVYTSLLNNAIYTGKKYRILIRDQNRNIPTCTIQSLSSSWTDNYAWTQSVIDVFLELEQESNG